MNKPLILSLVVGLAISGAASAQTTSANANNKSNNQQFETNRSSPVRGIERKSGDSGSRENADEYRSFDGSNNNLEDPEMGAAHTNLVRLSYADYSDGISSMAGEDRPSARAVSNAVFAQGDSLPNPWNASDMLWQWGQFLDHDLDLTDGIEPEEPIHLVVPTGDVFFDPESTGTATIDINRSLYDTETGTDKQNPREQINEITAWIDASNVYGSDIEQANALRTLDGSGRLKVSEGDLLPFNEDGLPNAGGDSASLFLAGDPRANEQIGLTVMHTLFVREHNRLADEIAAENPSLSGEEIYQQARRIVAAQMQVITYQEFLPLLLGENALKRYRGYKDDVDAGIANEFANAAYRLGHSLLSTHILRLDENGDEIEEGHLALRDAFFQPTRLATEGGIEPILRGLAAQECQTLDSKVVDDVRNFLFGAPGSGGFDLVSLNIQRGQDHGLPSYNDVREALGLDRVDSFSDINSDSDIQAQLSSVYESVDDIDLWAGGLAEAPYRDSMLGEVFHEIVKHQFEVLRDGDRFWYKRDLSEREAREVEGTRLSDIIRRNSNINDEIVDNVFVVSDKKDDRGRRRR